jgi:hypothetical protein
MVLSCRQYPDHNTIAPFIATMKDEILPLSLDVLLVCEEMVRAGKILANFRIVRTGYLRVALYRPVDRKRTQKRSVIPLPFWWLSITGSMTLLTYAIYQQDPVFILGQSTGVLIYFRNLYLLKMHPERTDQT